MLLLAMISLHILTARLMGVTTVAEFCSLIIFIHNTLLGEKTISNTRSRHPVMIHFHMQRFKFFDYMVIRYASSKEEKDDEEEHGQNVETRYFTSHIICILVVFHVH